MADVFTPNLTEFESAVGIDPNMAQGASSGTFMTYQDDKSYPWMYYRKPDGWIVCGQGWGEEIGNNTDVYVIRGSTIPNSKVIQRQEIMNAYQQGLLGDPSDPKLREKVLSMMEYGDVAEMWQDFSIDMAQINRGLDMMQKGEIPPVNELDNHPLWVQEVNRFRKSDKFEKMDDHLKAIIEANMEEHLQMFTNLQNPGLNQQVEMSELMAQKAQSMTPQDAQMHDQVANAHMPPEGAAPPPPGIQHLGV